MATIPDYAFTYKLRPIQQQWVLQHALSAARRVQHTEAARILAHADAITQEALDTDLAYQRELGTQPDGGDTRQADRNVIRFLKAVNEVLSAYAGGDRREAKTRRVAELQKEAFPMGYAHHATTNYETRLGLTKHFIAVMGRPAHADLLAELALTPVIATITQAQATFRSLMEPEREVTQEDRDAARDASLEHFMLAIYRVLGMFDPSDAQQVVVRDTILLPLLAMNDKLAHRYKQLKRGKRADDVAPPIVSPDELAMVAEDDDTTPDDDFEVTTSQPPARPTPASHTPVAAANAPADAAHDQLAAK